MSIAKVVVMETRIDRFINSRHERIVNEIYTIYFIKSFQYFDTLQAQNIFYKILLPIIS